ncbi:hypothetical protein [Streptomyces sp. NBRC 110465]|uniref:hypothetical protein n=1 Tax=Streptomyces sp. NBRC 110465 TaxID=1897621 RepID=UPI001160EE60|nr:hypothetical protein [Streptomyces sp. NBRC 110465]
MRTRTAQGRAGTAVLLHGWPVTTAHWRHLVPALEAAGIAALRLTTEVTGLVFDRSGHYPAEQEAADVNRAVVRFLLRHP